MNRAFEEFWKAFPARNGRKSCKQEAEKEFVALRLTEEQCAEVMRGLEVQKKHYAACKAARVFVSEFPDACRWLKKRRWEDEVETTAVEQFKDLEPEEVRDRAYRQRSRELVDHYKQAETNAVPMPAELRQMARRSFGFPA